MSELTVAPETTVRTTVLRALRRADLTGALSETELRTLAERSRVRRLSRGEVLWPPGEAARELGIVARGRVQCVFHRAGPRDWVSGVVATPGICGLPEVVGGCARRGAVEAVEPSLVVLVDADAVAALLEANPAFARSVARHLAGELLASFAAAEGVALRSPLQRVAGYLLERAHGVPDGGTRGENGAEMGGEIDATQGRVAARLGTVREVVGRALRRLEQNGLIERHGRAFRVLRADGLRRIAEGEAVPGSDAFACGV